MSSHGQEQEQEQEQEQKQKHGEVKQEMSRDEVKDDLFKDELKDESFKDEGKDEFSKDEAKDEWSKEEVKPELSKELATTSPPPKPNPISINEMKKHLSVEISTSHADILLLICCIISGLVDSTIYHGYGTFVSMQTGNTIFLGLGGSTPHSTSKPYGWVKSLFSIAFFCLGCYVFGLISRLLTPLRRSTLTASFLLQTLIIFVAAAIIQGGAVNGSLNTITGDIDWRQLLPIALLSFQSAGQIVGSRALGLAEVPTVVLTSMLHDISTDPALLGPLQQNVKRNRRVLAFLGILIGAIVGGFIAAGTERMQIPLWIAGGIKLCITISWMAWPEKIDSPV